MKQKRRKNKIRKKTIGILLILVVVAAAAGAWGIKRLQRTVKEQYGNSDDSEILTAEVSAGSIHTTVSGSGTLEDEEYTEKEIPEAVTWKTTYVEVGDTVAEGDLLISVDSASVMEAMADIQKRIAAVDDDLAEVAGDESTRNVTAPVAGRVKAIYGKAGNDVATVMADKGALVLLSLDGTMALDVPAGDRKVGDTMQVKVKDTTYTGTVDAVVAGTATVLISDKTAAVGAEATTDAGKGTLYIHRSLAVTEYTGTVSSVSVSVNQSVSEGATLLKLKDASGSAGYTRLLNQRSELEEDLKELVAIYKDGAVYAPCAGTVKTIEDGKIAICPDQIMNVSVAVDESAILSVQTGQEATLTIDSLSEETFTGEVTEIEKVGTSDSGVTTYNVTLQIPKDKNMLSGMTASVRIVIEGKDNALILPEAAINKTRSTVYVYTSYDKESGEFGDMVEVTVGISNGSSCEITSGLSEGDVVYYKNVDTSTSRNRQRSNRRQGSSDNSGGFPGGDFSGGFPEGGFREGGPGSGANGNRAGRNG